MSDDIKEQVKAELKARRVKLWLQPYYDKGPNDQALQALAKELQQKLCEKSQDEIVSTLVEFQKHAIDKLNEKERLSVEIKVVGLRGEVNQDNAQLSSWAEQVEITPKGIKLHRIDPLLTVSLVVNQLKTLFRASQVRLVHKGKTLSSAKDQARLSAKLHQKQANIVILCLVSYSEVAEKQVSPDYELIASIRNAAAKLQSGANFEITDQHGNLVSMRHAERLAFVTALGLHRLGRKRMDDGNLESALVFLLEADHEWNQVNEHWRDKVDNYGLLQLDIGWTYLKLKSLDSLPDVTRRLQVAESVLSKQVHTNFITLAEVQAEMGRPVPPLAAVFVRLFLLQGIAYRYSGDTKKSKEKLDSAWLLAQSLRMVSTDDAVSRLCDAFGVSKSCAISALRRSNGNPDQALALIEQDEKGDLEKKWEREQQHRIGLAVNGTDLVNVKLIAQLQSILGLSSPPSQASAQSSGPPQMDANYEATAGLLRLTNNDLEQAISLFRELNRDPELVFQRVDALDRDLEAQGISPRKRKRSRRERAESIVVDDVALATLLSMGVDESLAKKALKHSQNNVEMSLLWLSNGNASDDINESTANGSSGDASMEESSSSETAERVDQNESGSDSEETQAEDLLEQELSAVLQERDMEKEYLGSSLDEEWGFIEQFRGN